MKKSIFAVLFAVVALTFAVQARAQVIVIANPNVKATEIGKDSVRDIFTGAATSLSDGTRVVPILLKGGTEHEEFLKVFVGKSDTAFRATWRSLVFSAQASMPKSMDNDAAVVEFVTRNNGAIAYISKSTPHEGVKVLRIK
jgi:ABC-type phosphate transport system substrate-binding protein